MADVTIDARFDGDIATVENAELDLLKVTLGELQIDLNWEQAQSIFKGLSEFFFDSDDAINAVRYRRLRDESAGRLHVYRGTEDISLLPEELDAAIDALHGAGGRVGGEG